MMFLLMCATVNIQNILLYGSSAGMETSAPMVDGIVNSALFHSNSHINQRPPQIIHILRFFSGRLDAPDFVMKCNEVRAVRWPEVWYTSGLEVANNARTVR